MWRWKNSSGQSSLTAVWQEKVVAWSRWMAWEPKEERKMRGPWEAEPVGLDERPVVRGKRGMPKWMVCVTV